MKNHILSALTFLSLAGSACQATTPGRGSGVDFQLNAATEDARPEGVFHVRGIRNGVSVHVPAAPLDPGSTLQRVPLPPGTYSVSYSSVVLEGSLSSLRNRAPARILSENPFVLVVDEGRFSAVDVLALDGVNTPRAQARSKSMAAR